VGSIVIERQEFFDPQPVELAVEFKTPARVLSTADGILTAYDCRPGKAVVAGRVLARVGEAPVVPLATEIPLWRTITSVSTGLDVDAVHRELRRLRLITPEPLPAGSAAGSETIRALADLAKLPSTTREVPATAFAWIPRPRVTARRCPTTIGDQVSTGTPLIELAPEVTQVSLKGRPSDVVPGRRVLVVGTAKVDISPKGTVVSPQAIRHVLRTPLFRAFVSSGGKVPLQATWSLKRGLDVAALPASSVVVGSGSACVSRSGVSYPVRIITSELGKTLVVMDKELSAVDAVPSDDFACT